MRFVITGTGRNGTGYAAQLFTAAGLRCGHEEVFTVKPGRGERAAARSGIVARAKEPLGRLREDGRRRRAPFDGDASWMAAPRLKSFAGTSLLQLRHPIPVVRSFMGSRFFSEPAPHNVQHRFAAAYLSPTGDDVVDAMRWWVLWNEMAGEHADEIYALESLDATLFARLLSRIGVSDASARATEAFAAVPHDVNSSARRGDRPGSLNWDDLPEGVDKARLEEAATRWGYVPSDPGAPFTA